MYDYDDPNAYNMHTLAIAYMYMHAGYGPLCLLAMHWTLFSTCECQPPKTVVRRCKHVYAYV